MSVRSSRHAASKGNSAALDKFKKKCQNKEDSFDEETESNYYSSESDDMQNFVVGEQYQDEWTEDEQLNEKKKKKPEPKESLTAFLQKQSQKRDATKKTVKTSSAKADKSQINVESWLSHLDEEDDSKTSSRKAKRMQNQAKRTTGAFVPKEYIKKEPEIVMDDDDDFAPPPEPEPAVSIKETPKPVVVEKPKPVAAEKPKPKSAPKVQPMTEFVFEAVSNEGLDFSGEVEAMDRIKLDANMQSLEMFLFHVHEEEGRLFLFGKYKQNDRFYTISVQIPVVYYNLQFLPIDEQYDELIDEVRSIAKKCRGGCSEVGRKRMKYCFEDTTIDREADWVVAKFHSKCNIGDVPRQGKYYSNVFGLTASLTERFFVDTKIMGPCWIKVNNIKGFKEMASVPMVIVKETSDIELMDQRGMTIPPFNICTMAMRAAFNQEKKKNEVFMITLMFKQDWDIENWKETHEQSQTHITYVCRTSGSGLNTEYEKEVNNSGMKKFVKVCRDEKELLLNFVEKLDEMDVDMIASYGLTSFDMPLLLERLHDRRVQKFWKVGRLHRDLKDFKPKMAVTMGGRLPVDVRVSCGEFWKSKANDFSSIMKEIFNETRQQIDHFDIVSKLSDKESLKNLVRYNQKDANWIGQIMEKIQILPLTLQISKTSGCPWIRVLLGQASHRCESLLLHRFSENNYIIPEKQKSSGGPQKREAKYKGGMVLTPKRGFYETCICVLDFNSLYPSIIREYNICFTTVEETKDADGEVRLDAQKSKRKREKGQVGILPQIMERLLEDRKVVKNDIADNKKQLNDARSEAKKAEIRGEIVRLEIKEKAIKVLANSMYGYLGFKGSRFQANQLAALVTECGRNILEDTAKYMENQQFDVVYGDTDSVMVNTNTTDPAEAEKVAKQLSDAISEKYKFLKLGVDYVFQKMLLVQKKKYAAMVYKGAGQDPKIEMKGLDMVRRDWSVITKLLSQFIINQFMSGEERDASITSIIKELENVTAIMKNGGVALESNPSKIFKNGIDKKHLVITKALKKNLKDYPDNDSSPHVAVARRMAERGRAIAPNETIEYIICSSDAKELGKKARLPQEVNEFTEADIDWYLQNQLLHPLWRLCDPFGGMNMIMLYQALGLKVILPSVDRSSEADTSRSALIPRVAELAYTCGRCPERIHMSAKIDECFTCQNCSMDHSSKWRYVANQLTASARNFLVGFKPEHQRDEPCCGFQCDGVLCSYKTHQLPVQASNSMHYNIYKKNEVLCTGVLKPTVTAVEIYNTLRYFVALFDPQKTPTKHEEFREYMREYMGSLIKAHNFSCLSFRSIFGRQDVAERTDDD